MRHLFLRTFSNFIIENCDYGIYFDTQQTNSGERLTFENCTLGKCRYGIYLAALGLEFNLINSSIDFCDYGITTSASGIIVKMTNCHIEGVGFNDQGQDTEVENPYLFYSNGGFFGDNILMMTNCDIMTIRSEIIQAKSKDGVHVYLNGVTTKGSNSWKRATYLCSENCNIIKSNFYPSHYHLMATSKRINQKIESKFENIENQNIINNQDINGYKFYDGYTGIASIDNYYPGEGGKSIKIEVPSNGF